MGTIRIQGPEPVLSKERMSICELVIRMRVEKDMECGCNLVKLEGKMSNPR